MFRKTGSRVGYTIASPIELKGIGLMTGAECVVSLFPQHEEAGVFMRTSANSSWCALNESCVVDASARTTIVKAGDSRVILVEHLMSALKGMGVDHVKIQVQGLEIPGVDGSCQPFAQAIAQVGLSPTQIAVSTMALEEPISFESGGSLYSASPSDHASWHCVIDYAHVPSIGLQTFDFDCNGDYLRQVSLARTFCLEQELEKLWSMGLIKGGSLDCGVVFNDKGVLNPEGLRFVNEPARHKLLDLLGDLHFLGVDLQMHLVAIKPSHKANNELALMLRSMIQQAL